MTDRAVTTPPKPRFSARGCQLVITVDEGYLKAYAHPLDAEGEPDWREGVGLQGRPREQLDAGVRQLVDDFLEAAREARSEGIVT